MVPSYWQATEEAASLRSKAESEISDLTAKLTALRKETTDYCATLQKLLNQQTASVEQIKKLL